MDDMDDMLQDLVDELTQAGGEGSSDPSSSPRLSQSDPNIQEQILANTRSNDSPLGRANTTEGINSLLQELVDELDLDESEVGHSLELRVESTKDPTHSSLPNSYHDGHPSPPRTMNDSPQDSFEKWRGFVTLGQYEEQDRATSIREVGARFLSSAQRAAQPIPALLREARLELEQASQLKSSSLVPASGPSSSAVTSAQRERDVAVDAHGVRLVDAGGHAGGAKAEHKRSGLFMKTPDDGEHIYGSMVMAAKVMKLEVNANRHIHGIDSIHVSAPLSTIVDVPHVGEDGLMSVTRVQVQAKLTIGGDTLRVGSSDSGDTIHQDEEQDKDAVPQLSAHFHICPVEQVQALVVSNHVYHRSRGTDDHPEAADADAESHRHDDAVQETAPTEASTSLPVRLGMPSASGKELQSAASSISDSKTTRTHFESSAHTQQSSQRLPEFVSAIKARAGKQATVNFEEALQIPASRNNATSWVASAVVSSGVDLSYVAADEPRKTSCAAGGHRVESKELEENEYPLHPLPFDVEVHQLPSGQRMVLDSHRLLIPDVAWIDWMGSHGDARPHIWAISLAQRASAPAAATQAQSDTAKASVGIGAATGRGSGGHEPGILERGDHGIAVDGSDSLQHAVDRTSQIQWIEGKLSRHIMWPDCHRKDLSKHNAANAARLLSAINSWIRASSISKELQPGRISVSEYMREVGCIILKGEGIPVSSASSCAAAGAGLGPDRASDAITPQATWMFVVACPGWYFGNAAPLTCMLPAEAARVVRELGFPKVGPDCMLGDGTSEQKSRLVRELRVATKAVQSPERLKSAVIELMELPASQSDISQSVAEAKCDSWPGEHRVRGWSKLWQLRRCAKKLLHARGLALRHCGCLHREALSQGLAADPRWVDILLSCCLASPGSPAGSVLRSSMASARAMIQGGGLLGRTIAATILAGRCFASKGVQGLSLEVCKSLLPLYDERTVENLAQAFERVSQQEHPTGVLSAIAHPSAAVRTDGRQDDVLARRSVTQLLHELAHTQRVQGTGEGEILLRLAKLALLGSEYIPVSARVISRYSSLKEASPVELSNMLRAAGFVSEAAEAAILPTSEVATQIQHDAGSALQARGRALMQQGEYIKAMASLQAAQELGQELGIESSQHMALLTDIASCHGGLGQYQEGNLLLQRCKQYWSTQYGRGNPEYLNAIANIAVAEQEIGELDAALALHLECKAGMAQQLGVEHPRYLGCLNNIGICLRGLDRLDEAIRMHSDCRSTMDRVTGQHSTEYYVNLNNLACCYSLNGRPDTSLPLFQRCSKAFIKASGKPTLDGIGAKLGIASCYHALGDLEKARVAFEECKIAALDSIGAFDPCYLTVLNTYGNFLAERGELNDAIEALEECVAGRTQTQGASHPDRLTSMVNLAGTYGQAGQYRKSIDLFDECRPELAAKLGTAHDACIRSSIGHAISNLHVGDSAAAFSVADEALDILTAAGRQGEHLATVLTQIRGAAIAAMQQG